MQRQPDSDLGALGTPRRAYALHLRSLPGLTCMPRDLSLSYLFAAASATSYDSLRLPACPVKTYLSLCSGWCRLHIIALSHRRATSSPLPPAVRETSTTA